MTHRLSTLFLRVVVIVVALAALAALLYEPHTEGVNTHKAFFEVYLDPFIALVYVGSVPFFAALYYAFKLLDYAARHAFHSPEAVHALRRIRYCTLAVIGFVAAEELVIMATHGSDDAAGAFMAGVFIALSALTAAAFAVVLEGAAAEVTPRR
jgi:hypothetical protein